MAEGEQVIKYKLDGPPERVGEINLPEILGKTVEVTAGSTLKRYSLSGPKLRRYGLLCRAKDGFQAQESLDPNSPLKDKRYKSEDDKLLLYRSAEPFKYSFWEDQIVDGKPTKVRAFRQSSKGTYFTIVKKAEATANPSPVISHSSPVISNGSERSQEGDFSASPRNDNEVDSGQPEAPAEEPETDELKQTKMF